MDTREKQINIRLTKDEYSRLTGEAARKGIGRAAYLRMLLLEEWTREEFEGKRKRF